MAPTGREIGDAGHTRKGDDAAVVGADDELALSLDRRACHRPGYVAGARPSDKHALVRACDSSLLGAEGGTMAAASG